MSLTGESLVNLETGHPKTVALGAVLMAVVLGGSLLAFRAARDAGRKLGD